MVLSTYKVPTNEDIAHMYVADAKLDNIGKADNMKPFFSVSQSFGLQLCVFDLIWIGILKCSWNHQKSIAHAPYII